MMNSPSSPVTSSKSSAERLVDKELKAIYMVSRELGNSLQLEQTLQQVLKILHEEMGLLHGIITISDENQSKLSVNSIYTDLADPDELISMFKGIHYQSGEGIIGKVFASGESIVLGRVSSEPSFQHKLDIYDYELPFIGVAISDGEGGIKGVLAAQPDRPADENLAELTRFMQMVSNLIVDKVKFIGKVNKRQKDLAEERDELRREVRNKYGFDNMVVGRTDSMRRVFDQVRRVGKWNTTVLIRGESGTGKELIASAIHYNSSRSKNPFVKLNCAALPENLLESELFGHEKGAFTGAIKQRKGRFEQAHGGTLFLDEIGEISPMFQAKLLRVLQEGELERIGGNQTINVDVRIVAATNRNLEDEVDQGKFREDLFYRLNVMPIMLPPLRERVADIPELSSFLIGKISQDQKRELRITDSAVRALVNHDWPGNVRELENCLERASVMSEDGTIDLDVISLSGMATQSLPKPAARYKAPEVDINSDEMDERERVIAALEQAGWVQARAARLLGMTPRQIAYRIQTLNIHMRKI